jgi:hypothetical protein
MYELRVLRQAYTYLGRNELESAELAPCLLVDDVLDDWIEL